MVLLSSITITFTPARLFAFSTVTPLWLSYDPPTGGRMAAWGHPFQSIMSAASKIFQRLSSRSFVRSSKRG
jgi:hypothetical protein